MEFTKIDGWYLREGSRKCTSPPTVEDMTIRPENIHHIHGLSSGITRLEQVAEDAVTETADDIRRQELARWAFKHLISLHNSLAQYIGDKDGLLSLRKFEAFEKDARTNRDSLLVVSYLGDKTFRDIIALARVIDADYLHDYNPLFEQGMAINILKLRARICLFIRALTGNMDLKREAA
jgi:hypothetical protein